MIIDDIFLVLKQETYQYRWFAIFNNLTLDYSELFIDIIWY